MKRILVASGLAGILVFGLTGCNNMNSTQKGAVGGAVVGGLLGQAIGGNTASTVIGAVGGGLIGGAIGNSYDRNR